MPSTSHREKQSDPVSHRNRKTARRLVALGLITEAQARDCLLELEQQSPSPRLVELLLRRGLVSLPDLREAGMDRRDLPEDVADAALIPENRLGRYIRVLRIGTGGMGEVWKAWDGDLARWVALKFLRAGHDADPGRFEREARMAARLSHPNICRVYEFGQHDGVPFIAMELIDGEPFSRFPTEDRVGVVERIRDAARAVDHANREGVIHRDLKPQNMMLDPSGRIVVMDFGLARETAVDSSLSSTGVVVGTPAYMSPEQARGRSADHRSDVYSIGATLHEMLGGRLPFEGTNAIDVLHQVVSDDPAPLTGIPRDLNTIVCKCMEKEPARRYPNAGELAEDLSRYLKREPILAHPPSYLYRLRKGFMRRRGIWIAALIGLGVVSFLVPQWIGERRERERIAVEAARRESALKQLSSLWTRLVLARSGLGVAALDPAMVRRDIQVIVTEVDGYIREHPDQPQGWFVRARGRLYLDEIEKALSDARRSVELAPDFSPGHALLGRLILEKYVARTYVREALPGRRAEPELLRAAREALARGFRSEGDSVRKWGLQITVEDRVQEVITRALIAAYRDADEKKAQEVLREAHALRPSADYCLWLGNLSGNRAEQLRWYSEAIRFRPHFSRALHHRALIHLGLGDRLSAVRDLDAAAAVRPEDVLAHLIRGLERFSSGRNEEAIAHFTFVIRKDPEHALAFNSRGLCRTHLERRADAIEDFDRAIEIEPTYAIAHLNRGVVRLLEGDVEPARRDFLRCVELDPRLAKGWHNLALAQDRLGDRGAALDSLNRALKMQPDLIESLARRASVLLEMKDYVGSIRDLDRAIELEPKNPTYWSNRAKARLESGDEAGAIPDIRKALELAPPNWPYRRVLERALRHLQKK